MKQLIRNFKLMSIMILAISLTGCEEDDTILPNVIAGFTHTINADTGTVTFINTSENATNHEWDFGDESSSTLINPVKVYTNGTYTITLNAKNVAGDSDTFQDEITILIPEIATLPITFDGENTSYGAETFEGASFEIVDNPDLSGTNTSASKVGAITNIGAQFEGFYLDLGSNIDLTTLKSVSMNFWADAPVDVLVKLEEGSGEPVEASASHGGTGWETIILSFNSSDNYSRLTMFVDGPGTTAGTFYLDDIIQIESPPEPCEAETMQSLAGADFNLTLMSDPTASITADGGAFAWIDNPDFDNDMNKSCKVGEIIRDPGLPFANTQIEVDTKFDFNVNAGFKLKIWSPNANTNVVVKLEDKTNNTIFKEVTAVTGAANTWEELPFNFASGDSGKYDKIVLFFELNTDNGDTYYIDDFSLFASGGGGGDCVPETMQSLNAADFNLTFMSDPTSSIIEDNTTFEYVDNPDFSTDPNKSCKVGKVTNSNVAPWDNIQIDLADKLTFTSGSNFTMKIYSPQSGYKVTLKLEDKTDSGINTQVASTTSTTATNEWEELTIPFGEGDSGKYDKIVIFFDLETQNGSTYYFDDLKLNAGSGGGGGTFDDGLLTNGDFENGVEAWSGNALDVQTEGDNSFNFANVAAAGNASDVNLSQVVAITQGETYTLTFEASSDGNRTMVAGIGLNENPWTAATETVNLTSTTQTFTLTLSSADFGGANSRVIFDMGADTGVVVIDNVSLFCVDCGGGGGTGELTTNGGFETGDTSGWTSFVDGVDGATFTATNTTASSGTFSGNLVADFEAGSGGAVDAVVKQANIGIGTVTPNTQVTISFDIRGSAGDGGVFFAEFFSELSGGGTSAAEILSGGPLALSDTWTNHSFTTTTGSDVSGGITLQMKSSCGPVAGCVVDVFFDNVSVTLTP